ncbi:reverse transcriptase domain-containing protein [Tanacetum coccineum]
MNTAVAHPQANGLVERANKSLMGWIKTRLGREKVGWVDELPNVLWAQRTSIKTSNRETSFSLTYGSEAVIPVEIGMPTYRSMMIREGFNEEEILFNLDLLTERRDLAAIREARYKTKLEQYYNKKLKQMAPIPNTIHPSSSFHQAVKTKGFLQLKGTEVYSRAPKHNGKVNSVKSRAIITHSNNEAHVSLKKAHMDVGFALISLRKETQVSLKRIASLAIRVRSLSDLTA